MLDNFLNFVLEAKVKKSVMLGDWELSQGRIGHHSKTIPNTGKESNIANKHRSRGGREVWMLTKVSPTNP